MYSVPNGGILEAKIQGLLNDQLVMNTFHFQLEGGPYGNGAVALEIFLTQILFGGNFETKYWDVIRAAISADVLAVKLSAQWVLPDRKAAMVVTPTVTHGDVVTAACPSGVAVVVRKETEDAKRWGRGRIYIPGIAEADVADSAVTGAWEVANRTPLEDMVKSSINLDLGGTTKMNPVIWVPSVPGRATPIIGGTVDTILRYQRRREIGVGR